MFELATDGPKVIVCGVDGSDPSLHAAAYAWGLARRSDAHLVLVYAVAVAAMSTLTPGGAAVVREASEQVAEEMRAELEKAAERARVSYEFRREPGDPASVLTRIADEVRADAVIVGASAQAGHRLIGSVAVRLVRAGRWPVTVVP
ncbi:universal stress protein [Actinomadura oligospora]|uniref:universal stress protein n=1 Tax=Actinomadura oligospora TaxID=111804 RepID=UPI0004AC747F|nr:universal stress protein [Actinomadura oligospora]